MGPDPNSVYPNEDIKQVVFVKNVVSRPNIVVGEYTYYDDAGGAENFEDHVTHHYDFLGDKLVIGKFCAIARGIEFVMNGANHRMGGITTYPFNIMGGGWEKFAPGIGDLPFKGDTVIGNDVWIGQNVTVMPGVHIGGSGCCRANRLSGAFRSRARSVARPRNQGATPRSCAWWTGAAGRRPLRRAPSAPPFLRRSAARVYSFG